MFKNLFSFIFYRIIACFLDFLILLIALVFISYFFKEKFFYLGGNLWYISFVLFAFYFTFLDSKIGRGATIGKRIMGIRTLGENGEYLSIYKSFLRFLILSLAFFTSQIISFFAEAYNFNELIFFSFYVQLFFFFSIFGIMLLNSRRRGLHEYLSKSFILLSDSKNLFKKTDSLKKIFIEKKKKIIIFFSILILILVGLSVLNILSLKKYNSSDLAQFINEVGGIVNVSNAQAKLEFTNSGEESFVIISSLAYKDFKNLKTRDEVIDKIKDRIYRYKFLEDYKNIYIVLSTGYDLVFINNYLTSQTKYVEKKDVNFSQDEIKREEKLKIKNLKVKNIATSSAILEWNTNREAESVFYYGTFEQKENDEMIKAGENSLSYNHSQKIEDLKPGTYYYYKISVKEKTNQYYNSGNFITKDIDSDKDGLIDKTEKDIGTNPLEKDSDKDGYADGEEYRNSTNPLDELSNIDTVEINKDEILIDWLEEPRLINGESDCEQDVYGCPVQINIGSIKMEKLGEVIKGKYKNSILYNVHTYSDNYGNLMIYTGGDKNIILSNYSSNKFEIFPDNFEKTIEVDRGTVVKNLGIPKKIDLPNLDVSLVLPEESHTFHSEKKESISKGFEEIVYSREGLVIYKGLDNGCFNVFPRASWSGNYLLDVPFYGKFSGVKPIIPEIIWGNGEKNDKYYLSKPLARSSQCYSYLDNPSFGLEFANNISDNDLKTVGQTNLNGQPIYVLKDKEKVKELYNKFLPSGFIASVYSQDYKEVIENNNSLEKIVGGFTEEQNDFIENNSLSEFNFFEFTEEQINRLEKEHFLVLWRDPFGDLMIFHKPIFEENIK